MASTPPQESLAGAGDTSFELPHQNLSKLPIPHVNVADVPRELRAAWISYMKAGFENNQVMFRRTLEAFMRPYHITVAMYIALFVIGIGLFLAAVYLGLTGKQQNVAIWFGGLSVGSFILFFIRQPVQALEENLEFISWLGVAFNSYWTRLMYLSNDATVQQDIKDATDAYGQMVERLIEKHARLQAKRPGGTLVTSAPLDETPSSPAGSSGAVTPQT